MWVAVLALIVVASVALGVVTCATLTTIRRDRMAIRAMKARLAYAQELYEQALAATTDAERGRIIEALLKD